MTREEAIKIINCYDIGFYDLSGAKIPADKLVDAFDTAIEALSADAPSGDLISREDAIDALHKSGLCYDNWLEVRSEIDALPSAEAVHKPDYSYEADMVRRLKEALSAETSQDLAKPNKALKGSDFISREYAIKRFGEDGTWLERQGVTTLSLVEVKQRAVDLLESLPSANITDTEECQKCQETTERVLLNKASAEADRPTGEWVDTTGGQHYKCSVCGYRAGYWFNEENSCEYSLDMSEWLSNYCPTCGARMTPYKGGDTE